MEIRHVGRSQSVSEVIFLTLFGEDDKEVVKRVVMYVNMQPNQQRLI